MYGMVPKMHWMHLSLLFSVIFPSTSYLFLFHYRTWNFQMTFDINLSSINFALLATKQVEWVIIFFPFWLEKGFRYIFLLFLIWGILGCYSVSFPYLNLLLSIFSSKRNLIAILHCKRSSTLFIVFFHAFFYQYIKFYLSNIA